MRLGIDVGKARIGVARSDLHGMLATPVETVPRDTGGEADLRRIAEIARELDAFEAIVGLPLNMRGERTPSTDDAATFAQRLAAHFVGNGAQLGAEAAQLDSQVPIAVRLVDERLSTVSAQGHLRQAGKKTKQSRSIIDQAAAVVILQHALDIERSRDQAPGEAVVLDASEHDTKEHA